MRTGWGGWQGTSQLEYFRGREEWDDGHEIGTLTKSCAEHNGVEARASAV